MNWSGLRWWQSLLISTGCFGAAIILVKVEQHGYVTFAGLIVSLLASTAGAVFFVVGLIRFAKWIWTIRNSNTHLGGSH